MNRLVRYFPESDLRMGYEGLKKLAKKEGLDLQNLGAGEFAAFVNRDRTKVKLCTGADVLAYMRMPRGAKLDPRTIQLLPRFFNGQKINYDAAIRTVLRESFPAWFARSKEA